MGRHSFAILTASILMIGIMVGSGRVQAHMEAGEKAGQSLLEMQRLVAPGTKSRTYFWCAVLSQKLNMMDVYGMFFRKAATFTQDGDALVLSLSYVMGLMESELLGIEKDEAGGQILGALYSKNCMPELMPSK